MYMCTYVHRYMCTYILDTHIQCVLINLPQLVFRQIWYIIRFDRSTVYTYVCTSLIMDWYWDIVVDKNVWVVKWWQISCIYRWVCTYILCTYVCHMYVCGCKYTYACTYIRIYVYVGAFTYVHTYTSP